MKNGRKLGLLVAVLALVGVMATSAYASTVGDIYLGIAKAKNLRVGDAITAEAALRAAGYDLPRMDRNKVLTQGDVAAIANAVGIRAASSNPTASFSQGQVDRFVAAIGSGLNSPASSRIAARSGEGNNTEMSGSGSGKGKKPKSKSPKKPKPPKKPPKPKSGGSGHCPPGLRCV